MIKFCLFKTRLALSLVACALLVAFFPQAAHACSCVPPRPPSEALASASAVFTGKVILWQYPDSNGSSLDPIQVTFDVSQVWKGPAFRKLRVSTPPFGSSCGYGFYLAQEYLVYAYGDENDLEVSLCGRTRMVTDADEDLSALGNGLVPTANNPALPWLFLPQIYLQN